MGQVLGGMVSYNASGNPWVPRFIKAIDTEKCLGCGRCYKICGRGVLMLKEFEDDEDGRMVMGLVKPGECIGCEACQRACPKKCFSHAERIPA